jgi:beta-lactam-binding protein with PASTA domain
MPSDLAGKTVAAAKQELNSLNLNLQITVQGPGGGQPGDNAQVYQTNPAAGTQLQEGQPVTLMAVGGGGGNGGLGG